MPFRPWAPEYDVIARAVLFFTFSSFRGFEKGTDGGSSLLLPLSLFSLLLSFFSPPADSGKKKQHPQIPHRAQTTSSRRRASRAGSTSGAAADRAMTATSS
jgi:hypothetical protein